MAYNVHPVVEQEAHVFVEKSYDAMVGIWILNNSMNLRQLQVIIDELLIVGLMPLFEHRSFFYELSFDFVLAYLLELNVDIMFTRLSFHQKRKHTLFLLLL